MQPKFTLEQNEKILWESKSNPVVNAFYTWQLVIFGLLLVAFTIILLLIASLAPQDTETGNNVFAVLCCFAPLLFVGALFLITPLINYFSASNNYYAVTNLRVLKSNTKGQLKAINRLEITDFVLKKNIIDILFGKGKTARIFIRTNSVPKKLKLFAVSDPEQVIQLLSQK